MKFKTSKDPATGTYKVQVGNQTINTGLTAALDLKRLIKTAAALQGLGGIHIGPTVTLSAAVAAWEKWLSTAREDRTAQNYLTYIHAFLAFHKLADSPVTALNEHHVDKWINDPKSPVKAATRTQRLAVIRAFFDYCLMREYCLRDPSRACHVKMKLLSHDQKERRVKKPFKPAEYRALLECIDGRIANFKERLAQEEDAVVAAKLQWMQFWYSAVRISRNAGLRIGDIAQLEWAVFKEPGSIIVWTDKRDTRVRLRIDKFVTDPKEFRQAVKAIARKDNTWCFPFQKELTRNPALRAEFSNKFQRLLTKAGIEGHSFHDLRHGYASDSRKRGIPMPHIRESMAHAHERMTEHYIHEED